MPLPIDVYRRLTIRAVTDPDVASLLALFTKLDEAVSEHLLNQLIEDTSNSPVVARATGRSAA
jgi:catabolite regulation protein CreA